MTVQYFLQNTSTGERLSFPDDILAQGYIILGDDQEDLDTKYPDRGYTWPAVYTHPGNIWMVGEKRGPISDQWELITDTATTPGPNPTPSPEPAPTPEPVPTPVPDPSTPVSNINIEDFYEYYIYNYVSHQVVNITEDGLEGTSWMSLSDQQIQDYGLESSPAVYNYREHYAVQNNGETVNNWTMYEEIATCPDVKRLYNSSTGKHLFSNNEYEIALLEEGGWQNEGTSYFTPAERTGTADIYRFFVASEGRHFYTALEYEKDLIKDSQEYKDAGWQFEGKAFTAFASSDDSDTAVGVVRYFNQETGLHVYSTSSIEQGVLDQDVNWINEGVAWYGNLQTTDYANAN